MIQQFRIKRATGMYIQNISLDYKSKENSNITYTENRGNSLIISELEISVYKRLLNDIIGNGSYSFEQANDLD